MHNEAAIITGHYAMSRRRASIHEIGDALWRRGFTVSFITVGLSFLSYVIGDVRLGQISPPEIGKVRETGPRRHSFVWKTPWHPANARIGVINAVLAPIYERYGDLSLGPGEDLVRRASLVIVESGAGVLLAARIRRLNPSCRLVYRVSDDVRVLECHGAIVKAERRFGELFDLVSVASPLLAALLSNHRNLVVHRHGFDPKPLDAAVDNPYRPGSKNIVSVGTMLFDEGVIRTAAEISPSVNFHVIGNARFEAPPNVTLHGEMKYCDMLPYVKFADVGLASYRLSESMEYLADTSNKMILYTAARLPVIAPSVLANGRSNVFGYDTGRPSLAEAIKNALQYDRSLIAGVTHPDWDQFAGCFLSDAGYADQ
jgi:2-beta-glucuronyltransferase